MKNSLLFDFVVNKDNNTITVKREFAANLSKVWAAWTEAELLDQWWAPKPYKAKTKTLDFKEGGYWLYAMVSPEGQEHWCKADYQSILPKETFAWRDAFCDSEGNITDEFPRTFWTNHFSEGDSTTTVNILLQYDKLEDLEKIIEMGFKEGFTMGLENLDELLASQS